MMRRVYLYSVISQDTGKNVLIVGHSHRNAIQVPSFEHWGEPRAFFTPKEKLFKGFLLNTKVDNSASGLCQLETPLLAFLCLL